MDTYVVLGLLSIAVSIVSYSFYVRNTVKRLTRPHAITWLIWSALNALVFLEQVGAGAGPGAWVTGSAALGTLLIFFLALRFGERNITRFDWACLGLVGVMLLAWIQIDNPVISVGLAVFISFIGLLPTIVKASRYPHEETATTFLLNGVKFTLSVMALSSLTLATALYPVSLFVMNVGFALYLIFLRQYTRLHPITRRRPVHKQFRVY